MIRPIIDTCAAVDEYVDRELRRLKVPGASLAIVEGDRIVHARGFGQAEPFGPPPTPQTPFHIGSVAKSFTALAIMQLVDRGLVDLDAPVQRSLPWFRVADPQALECMTVRHLLNQTSGFGVMAGSAVLGDLSGGPDATERQLWALAFNHEVVDGSPAARFSKRLKELIEGACGLEELNGMAA